MTATRLPVVLPAPYDGVCASDFCRHAGGLHGHVRQRPVHEGGGYYFEPGRCGLVGCECVAFELEGSGYGYTPSRQLALVAAIDRYWATHGFSPSLADLAPALTSRYGNPASTNVVSRHVIRLRIDGLVEPAPFNMARAIRLTDAGRDLLEAKTKETA